MDAHGHAPNRCTVIERLIAGIDVTHRRAHTHTHRQSVRMNECMYVCMNAA